MLISAACLGGAIEGGDWTESGHSATATIPATLCLMSGWLDCYLLSRERRRLVQFALLHLFFVYVGLWNLTNSFLVFALKWLCKFFLCSVRLNWLSKWLTTCAFLIKQYFRNCNRSEVGTLAFSLSCADDCSDKGTLWVLKSTNCARRIKVKGEQVTC